MPTTRVYKPIWGFGWVGWIAVAAGLALVIATASGIDLQFVVLSCITAVFGGDAAVYVVAQPMVFTWLAVPATELSPIVLAWIAIGWRITPARVPWWAWAIAAAVCWLGPTARVWTYTTSPFDWVYAASPLGKMHTFLLVPSALLALIAVLVLCIERTKTSVVLWTFAVVIAFAEAELGVRDIYPPTWSPQFLTDRGIHFWVNPVTIVMHTLILAAMLQPAIMHRRWIEPDACLVCGYSRAGLAESSECPECGTPPELTPTLSPPPAPPPRAPAP